MIQDNYYQPKSFHLAQIFLLTLFYDLAIFDPVMNAKKVKRQSGRKLNESSIPFSKLNYQLFGTAFFLILVGYWALAQLPVDGFLTLTFAPILLVLGYCVVIPLAIMIGGKNTAGDKT